MPFVSVDRITSLHQFFAARLSACAASSSQSNRFDRLPSPSHASRTLSLFPLDGDFSEHRMAPDQASSPKRPRPRVRRQPKRSAKSRYADPPSRAKRRRLTSDRRSQRTSRPSRPSQGSGLKSVLRKSFKNKQTKAKKTPKSVHFILPSSGDDRESSSSTLTELSDSELDIEHGAPAPVVSPCSRSTTPEQSISSRDRAVEADYNDPTALILLEAESAFFRVHEWYLARHSGFFRGLLAVATTNDSLTEPIETEVTASGLRTFLAFLYSPVPPSLRHLRTFDLLRLFALVDRWEVAAMANFIDEEVSQRVKQGPWETFAAASWIPNIAVGKEALRHMADDFRFAQGDQQCEPTSSYCRRDISASWTTELMRLRIVVPRISSQEWSWHSNAPVFGRIETNVQESGPHDVVGHLDNQKDEARRKTYRVPDWLEIARQFSPSRG